MPLMTLLLLGAAALVQSAQPAPEAPACAGRAEYRQLDFWLGEWSVTAGGKAIATSSITRDAGGCAILEHYRQADGYTGKSLNFFDPVLGQWRQTWIDSGGMVSEFTGEAGEAVMRFTGESHRPGGVRILRRMTLTRLPDGTLRQSSERSDDNGATWQQAYDFVYVPVSAP